MDMEPIFNALKDIEFLNEKIQINKYK
jgi:hypothetical protein